MPRPEPKSPAAPRPPSGADGMRLSLGHVVGMVRKQLLLVLLCTAAVFALTFFWTMGQKKIYRAESLIRLDPEPPRPLGTKVELVGSGNSNYWNRREFYETEYRVIRSLRVTSEVVRRLGLNADPAFLGIEPNARIGFKPVSIEVAARVLIGRLGVDPVRDSSLAVVRYEDTDPKRCEAILNTVVRTYLSQNVEGVASLSKTSLEWLNSQLGQLKKDLEKSEYDLNDFRQKNNVLSISLEDRHNLITAQLEEVAKRTGYLDGRRSELAARVRQLNAVTEADPMAVDASVLLASPLLTSLRTSYGEQLRALDEMTTTLDENHPKVKAARAKLEKTGKLIAGEIANHKAAAIKDLKEVDQQLADAKKRDDELQKQAHELQRFEIPFKQLDRTRLNNEKVYSMVLERARETDLTRLMSFNNITIVDEATQPAAPVRPNVPVNLATGLLIGVFAGIGLAVAREVSDRSIKDPSDVEHDLGLSCLGVIPEITKTTMGREKVVPPAAALALNDRDLIVARHPHGGVAEATRAIRTNLMFMSPDEPYRMVLVTSAVPEEGKTTFACSLATVLAQSGARTLLIDTDLRRPRLHRTFRLPNDVGVTMAVTGQAELDECIRETPIENLSVMTSGPIPPNPAELLHSERFHKLAEDLRGRFDRIVFDSPPQLAVTDAAILGQLVDGCIIVARAARTHRAAIRQAARQLSDVNAPIAGVVVNALDLSRTDYGGSYYYYRRDNYYAEEES
jgi:polysaccharide biosynthesis transport protein